jgi:hypothetical protein
MWQAVLSLFMGALLFTAPSPAQELITTWSDYTHPLSYQGRTLTRDSSGNYYAVIRGGNNVNIWKRTVTTGNWQNLGAVNSSPLSGRQGDCAAIAVDGNNYVHVVYYNGSSPDLAHRRSTNGTSFGSEHLIATAVTWGNALAGGPFLHVDQSNGLHVAYVDGSDQPHYAYSGDGGSSWGTQRISSLGHNTLRPSVVTLPSGRIVYGCGLRHFRCFISDNGGGSWQEASPPTGTYTQIDNCRLHAHDSLLFVSGQKVLPEPRAVWMNMCDGDLMNWQSWEVIWPGDGADASMFADAQGGLYAVWRQYPAAPRSVYLSSRDDNWARTRLTMESVDFIFPFVYWQEYHRGAPADNRPAYLAPDGSYKRIYFDFIDGLSYPDGGAPPTLSPVSSFTGAPELNRVRLEWQNPPDSSFVGTLIRFSTTGYPQSPTAGTLVCDRTGSPGSLDNFTQYGLSSNTVYYYSAFAYAGGGVYANPVYLEVLTKPDKPSNLRIIDD